MKHLKQQLGFTMIEILIMISLIALAFVAIMSLVIKNVQMEQVIKNDFTAVSLAKEGIELVEEVRNDNLAQGYNFYKDLTVLSPINGSTHAFAIEYITDINNRPRIIPVADISDPQTILKFNNTDYYQHTGSGLGQTESKFKRMITTVFQNETDDLNAYLKIISEVHWEYKGNDHSYRITTLLFDDNLVP